jgi:hypothetical protein
MVGLVHGSLFPNGTDVVLWCEPRVESYGRLVGGRSSFLLWGEPGLRRGWGVAGLGFFREMAKPLPLQSSFSAFALHRISASVVSGGLARQNARGFLVRGAVCCLRDGADYDGHDRLYDCGNDGADDSWHDGCDNRNRDHARE